MFEIMVKNKNINKIELNYVFAREKDYSLFLITQQSNIFSNMELYNLIVIYILKFCNFRYKI